MSNEAADVQAQAPVSQDDAATTPIDLAQAFKMLNKANREAAQEHVGDGGDGGQGGDDPAGGPEVAAGTGQEVPDVGGGEAVAAAELTGSGGDDDGSSDGIEAIDFNAYRQGLLREVQQDAVQQIRKEFADQNIGYYSVGELTVRDPQTGRVMFRNPDVQDERDPNYYFNSRSEMQAFIDAWNKGVDNEFRRAVNDKQRELMQQAAPKARLAEFVPKWQAMDSATKAVFDELLEGHEIRDASGKEIGFDVNLDAVAAQAKRIASRFGGGQQAQQAAQQVAQQAQQQGSSGGPALDMPGGNGKSPDEAEPKNIGEALKMFDKRNKGGK